MPTVTRDQIVTTARNYLGCPWMHHGRNRNGIDCVGLLVCVCHDLGLPVEDMKGYSAVPTGFGFMNHFLKQAPINKTRLLLPGSIAMIRGAERAAHCGIFAEKDGRKSLIHSSNQTMQVEEVFWEPGPRSQLVFVLDFPGVLD